MAGGSGKGDSTTGTIRLPKEVEALAQRNLAAAEKAGQIGYVPYQGPTVRAFNPMEVNSMKQNEAAMRAFGMNPASVDATIPQTKTYAGGVQGYDPMALYDEGVNKIDPVQLAAIRSFTNPQGAMMGGAGGAGGSGANGIKGGVTTPMSRAQAADDQLRQQWSAVLPGGPGRK